MTSYRLYFNLHLQNVIYTCENIMAYKQQYISYMLCNRNAFNVDLTLTVCHRLFPPNFFSACCFHTSLNVNILPLHI